MRGPRRSRGRVSRLRWNGYHITVGVLVEGVHESGAGYPMEDWYFLQELIPQAADSPMCGFLHQGYHMSAKCMRHNYAMSLNNGTRKLGGTKGDNVAYQIRCERRFGARCVYVCVCVIVCKRNCESE